MTPYLYLFGFIFILYNLTLFNDKYMKYISSLFMIYIAILFVGLKDFVGVDDLGYLQYFNETENLVDVLVGNSGYYSYPRAYEIGYFYLMSFSKVFSDSFYFFQFIVTIMCVSLIYYAYKKLSSNANIAILLFIGVLYIPIVMHQYRNGLAMAFALLSIVFFLNKNYYKYLFTSLITMSFHFTSLFLFLLPIIYILKNNYILYILLLIGSFLFSYFELFTFLLENIIINYSSLDLMIVDKIAGKFSDERYMNVSVVFGLSLLKSILILTLYFIMKNKIHPMNYLHKLISIYFLGLLIYVGISEINIFATRIFRYFILLEPIVLSILIMYFKNNYIKYIVPVLYFILHVVSNFNMYKMYPYNNILN